MLLSLGLVVGLYIFVCIGLIAVFVLGPNREHRDGLLGKAHRVLVRVPGLIGTCCCVAASCGRWATGRQRWSAFEERITQKKHPALVVFYIVLVWAVEGLYLWFVVTEMDSFAQRFFTFALIFVAEYSFIAACRSDPGIVSARDGPRKGSLSAAQELQQNERYPFDGVLYCASTAGGTCGVECYTCHVPRPSRSKHCSLCGHCVRRFDHHCPWLNNDVGENNLRHFIAFLVLHVIACFKGGYDCVMHCLQFLEQRRVWSSYFVDGNGNRQQPTYPVVLLFLFSHKVVVACVALFAILVGCMLLWFTMHHVRMMIRNITTNDEGKIDAVIDYVTSCHSLTVFEGELRKLKDERDVASKAATDKRRRDSEANSADGGSADERIARAHERLRSLTPSFLDERAANRLRSDAATFNPNTASPKENRARRGREVGRLRAQLYETFSLGSWWSNFMDSISPSYRQQRKAAASAGKKKKS